MTRKTEPEVFIIESLELEDEKARRQEGDLLWVIKRFARDAQPRAQSIAACVIEWHTRFVDFSATCLGGDQYSGRRMQLHNRAGTERQMLCAERTGTNLGEQ